MNAPPPKSIAACGDMDPYAFYDALRERGPVVWDEGMQAWLVTGMEACRFVLRNDKKLFNHAHQSMSPEVQEISGGPNIVYQGGEAHTRLHQWFVRILSPQLVESWRPAMVRPIVERVIGRFAGAGRAELVSQLAEKVPIRVISRMLGLPWDDDAWVDHCRGLMYGLNAFFNNIYDPNVIAGALQSARAIEKLLMPCVLERRDGRGEDVISMMWRDCPALVPGWDERHTFANARTMFFAGTDTTNTATANAFHMLLTRPDVMAQLRSGGEPVAVQLVEEALRFHGSIHIRNRVALEDCEVAAVPIRKGQRLLVVLGAANRDPAACECPHEFRLERGNRNHIAFALGPRTCVGATLARANILETVQGALRRLPGLRLDPDAEPPQFRGFIFRGFRPLHVLFTPG